MPSKNGSVVQLDQGILRFASKQPVILQAFSGAVEFRTQGSGISSGEIRILGNNRFAVVAADSAILVTANGGSLLIPKGYEYVLDVPAPTPQGTAGASGAKQLSPTGVVIVAISVSLLTLTSGLLLNATRGNRSAFASPFFP